MDFLDIAQKRYSVRHYLNRVVEQDKLDKILLAGSLAPTSGNGQPFKVLVLQEPNQLQKLSKASVDYYNAPLVLIICGDHTNLWHRPFDNKALLDIDTSIVTDHMMLEATTQGLGSVWIGFFNPQKLKEEFNIPTTLEPINILAIGYAHTDALEINNYHSKRKSYESTTIYDTF